MDKNWEKEYKWLIDILVSRFGKDNVLTEEEDCGEVFAVGARKNGKAKIFRVEKLAVNSGFSLNKYANKMKLALKVVQKLEKYFET